MGPLSYDERSATSPRRVEQGGWRVELALARDRDDWNAAADTLFGVSESAETIAYHDAETGHHRFARYDADGLAGAFFLSPQPVAVSRDWAVRQLVARHGDRRSRFSVIAGRPAKGAVDKGATVCSCFQVGVNEIVAAVARGCTSVAAVGQTLQAGTNCGSCRAEIRAIIEMQSARAAE